MYVFLHLLIFEVLRVPETCGKRYESPLLHVGGISQIICIPLPPMAAN